MKGYTVDVRGFSVDKKKLVVEAIDELIGTCTYVSDRAMDIVEVFTTTDADGYSYHGANGGMYGDMNDSQLANEISFEELMLEAGLNYVEDGAKGFKAKSPNKTRPLITREQYDAVMAQSDKRTFTKALDDLLAIEKEQLLDESAIRINQLEGEVEHLNKVITSKNKQLSSNSGVISKLSGDNERLTLSIAKGASELYAVSKAKVIEADGLKEKLEKHKRISGVLSLLLISSVAAQLAVIFLGG